MDRDLDLSGDESYEPVRIRRGQYAPLPIRFLQPLQGGESERRPYDLTGCIVHVRIYADGLDLIELPVTITGSDAFAAIEPIVSSILPSVATLGISIVSAGGKPRPLAYRPIYVEDFL